jgi:hypothetical protein
MQYCVKQIQVVPCFVGAALVDVAVDGCAAKTPRERVWPTHSPPQLSLCALYDEVVAAVAMIALDRLIEALES